MNTKEQKVMSTKKVELYKDEQELSSLIIDMCEIASRAEVIANKEQDVSWMTDEINSMRSKLGKITKMRRAIK